MDCGNVQARNYGMDSLPGLDRVAVAWPISLLLLPWMLVQPNFLCLSRWLIHVPFVAYPLLPIAHFGLVLHHCRRRFGDPMTFVWFACNDPDHRYADNTGLFYCPVQ
jgi:hypothetical protein